MSVFSKLKFAKKAAEEQKAKAKAKEQEEGKGKGKEVVKEKYMHVPRHAALDALSGAPSSWKHEDRPKIKEHHKRRSQMHINRTSSALSQTYDGRSTLSAQALPRNSSYCSYNPTWWDRGDYSYLNEPYQKRNKPLRNQSYTDSGIGPSPLVSQVTSTEVSPVASSNSSVSSNNLEMLPTKKRQPQPSMYGENDVFERLHKSKTRKVGEAPILTSPPQTSVTPSIVSLDEREKRGRWFLKGKGREISVAA